MGVAPKRVFCLFKVQMQVRMMRGGRRFSGRVCKEEAIPGIGCPCWTRLATAAPVLAGICPEYTFITDLEYVGHLQNHSEKPSPDLK